MAQVLVSTRMTFMQVPKPEKHEASKQAWKDTHSPQSSRALVYRAEEKLSKMSEAEVLRGFVTERLAAAAQEILAVVERTLAGYEEEATGFRQEIDRQRRQLEVLLQPEIKLESTGRWLSALGVNGP